MSCFSVGWLRLLTVTVYILMVYCANGQGYPSHAIVSNDDSIRHLAHKGYPLRLSTIHSLLRIHTHIASTTIDPSIVPNCLINHWLAHVSLYLIRSPTPPHPSNSRGDDAWVYMSVRNADIDSPFWCHDQDNHHDAMHLVTSKMCETAEPHNNLFTSSNVIIASSLESCSLVCIISCK